MNRLALWALVMLSGCAAIFMERHVDPEPGADMRNQRVFVVPFSAPGLWYGDSEVGREFRMTLLGYLQHDCLRSEFVSNQEVLYDILGCAEDEVPWTQFGQKAEADMIVFGGIESIAFEKTGWVGMMQGQLRVSLHVWNVARNEQTYETDLSFVFPDDPEKGEIMPAFGESERELRFHLFKRASKAISKLFCGGIEDVRGPDGPR